MRIEVTAGERGEWPHSNNTVVKINGRKIPETNYFWMCVEAGDVVHWGTGFKWFNKKRAWWRKLLGLR